MNRVKRGGSWNNNANNCRSGNRVEAKPVADPVMSAKKLGELYQKRLLANILQESLENIRGESPVPELVAELETNLSKVQRAVEDFKTAQIFSWHEIFPEILTEIAVKQLALKDGATTSYRYCKTR